jgi:hypothetical protein
MKISLLWDEDSVLIAKLLLTFWEELGASIFRVVQEKYVLWENLWRQGGQNETLRGRKK